MNKPKLPVFDVQSLTSQRQPLGVYWLLLLVLSVLILITGASIALQSQERHRAYRELQALKKHHATLKSEEQRLLIEQQTFSATSQVVRLSVDKLGMFFPAKQHRQIITPSQTPTTQGETQP